MHSYYCPRLVVYMPRPSKVDHAAYSKIEQEALLRQTGDAMRQSKFCQLLHDSMGGSCRPYPKSRTNLCNELEDITVDFLFFSFRFHNMDFPDCLLLLLSISVFLLFSFSVFTLF